MRYLKSEKMSKINRYKVCIVCNNKKKLFNTISTYRPFAKIANNKKCGWVGFVYLNNFDDAFNLRKKLYYKKDLYVFLQDDEPIINKLTGE